MRAVPIRTEPWTRLFADDGSIPNNPVLPAVIYRGAVDLTGTPDPAEVIEELFAANGWGDMWRAGIYPFPHYHSRIHEVMGVARGKAKLLLGGKAGEEAWVASGDVIVLPAGTGHQCLSSTGDLLVVGAYPPNGRYDLCQGSRAEHKRALASVPKAPPPTTDPVYGADGPLMTLWQPAPDMTPAV